MDIKFNSFPEIISVGIFDSRIAFGDIEETKNRLVSMYEIEIPIQKGGVSYINNTKYELDKNMLLCAKPGQIRHSKLHFKAYYIHLIVNDESLRKILNSIPDMIEIRNRDEYTELFQDIITADSLPSQQNALLLQSKIFGLLFKLCNDTILYGSHNQNSQNEEVINKAVSYMNSHYLENITLSDVAEYVHLSRIYFHNMFKSASGLTPFKYITKKRIEDAKKYLILSETSMSEICELCGFSSNSYFNYAFKRETGMTPGEFKKKYRNK